MVSVRAYRAKGRQREESFPKTARWVSRACLKECPRKKLCCGRLPKMRSAHIAPRQFNTCLATGVPFHVLLLWRRIVDK